MTVTALAGVQAPAAGRRVTPTARLILPADANRDDWLTARRRGIGSSDITAMLGLSKYGNELSVYYDKRGELPLESDDSEPAYWGRVDEDGVARRWAASNRSSVRRVGLVANVERPWQMCTLDRRVDTCPIEPGAVCALEIKCRDKMKASMWRRGCPDDVLAQTLHQADTCGFDHMHVAVKIGGNDYRQFTVRVVEHQQLVLDLRAAAAELWQRIVDGRPPVLSPDADPGPLLDLYRRLHPDRSGTVHIDRDGDAQDALADYLDAVSAKAEAETRRKAAQARLYATLGGAEMAVLGDRPAYSIEQRSKQSPDLSRLAERWPEAYADCVTDKPYDQISIPTDVRKRHSA
ncbi:YqaJ viral recombinase family protein [Kitasatospora sp. NPDC127116]|uniref:YqaJ viral recombinase family nuclease n=1 Tax=Kitasatospora sp. NPDC127116 TaxID=3345367 RepID=UPI003638E43F